MYFRKFREDQLINHQIMHHPTDCISFKYLAHQRINAAAGDGNRVRCFVLQPHLLAYPIRVLDEVEQIGHALLNVQLFGTFAHLQTSMKKYREIRMQR